MSSDLSEPQDKPLVERLRDSTAHTYSSENADLYQGFDNGRESAAAMVEAFVREHLTEQTEPSAEDWQEAEMWNHSGEGVCFMKWCSYCEREARGKVTARNAVIRRIRELLVGKERP